MTSVYFTIHDITTSYPISLGRAETFDAAEEAARQAAARRGISVRITKITQTSKRQEVKWIATVVRDVNDRVWTDLSQEGALLV